MMAPVPHVIKLYLGAPVLVSLRAAAHAKQEMEREVDNNNVSSRCTEAPHFGRFWSIC